MPSPELPTGFDVTKRRSHVQHLPVKEGAELPRVNPPVTGETTDR